MAKMRVVLKEPVPALGEIGDIVSVAGGYARNFLIPRGFAVPATKGNVKHADTWKQSKAARSAKVVTEANQLKAKLEAQPLAITAQAGPDGRLFGSITTAQIADALSALGIDVDRHMIELEEPIRHLGLHEVKVPLHAEVTAVVTVEATAAQD